MSLPSFIPPILRLLFITVLGFASGLPLALTGQSMQAWLTVDGLDLSTIGFLALVGLPYTFKFLWAPLMDRFEPPFLPRRIGWLVLIQLLMMLVLLLLATTSPKNSLPTFALLAVLLAFLSASQDVMIDAYRNDVLPADERGMGASVGVLGYRLAMIFSGGIALIWADPQQGSKTWGEVYAIMAWVMAALAVFSLVLLPRVSSTIKDWAGSPHKDLIGFVGIVLVVVAGYFITVKLLTPLCSSVVTWLSTWFAAPAESVNATVHATENAVANTVPTLSAIAKRWVDMLALLFGIVLTLPIAWQVMRRTGFVTLNAALDNFLTRPQAMWLLVLIVFYKLGDAFAGSLLTPFLLKGMAFSQIEVGVVNKILGIWITIAGALLGGTLMFRLGLYRSLFWFAVFQGASNFGFYLIAISTKGAWGALTLPAFDLGLVELKTATLVDTQLLLAIVVENVSGGMGTAAFVAFLMTLCHVKFSATQYALLSAFASVGRVWVGPLAGVVAQNSGWPTFFIWSLVLSAPVIALLLYLRPSLVALGTTDKDRVKQTA